MAGTPPARNPRTADPATDETAALTGALLRQMRGITWATDRHLRCHFASTDAADRLGVVVGLPLAELIDDGELVEAHRTALDGTGSEVPLRRGDAMLRCRVEPLRDPSGAVIGVLASARDVAEPQGAERLVEMQRAVFAAALDHSPIGISVCDAGGRFIYSNLMSRRFEAEPSEGKRIGASDDPWGQWFDESGPIGHADWPMTRALRGEVVPATNLFTKRPDGSLHHLQVAAMPIRDATGCLLGVIGTATDISDRKHLEHELRALNRELEDRVRTRTAELEAMTAELTREVAERAAALERLARSEELLDDVVNHSTAVIYLKDLDGRYLLVNRQFEKVFGVRAAEQRGRTDYDLFSREMADGYATNDRMVLAADGPLAFEEVALIQGELRTFVSLKFPLRDRAGIVYGVCGMSTDITDRKRMEAELRRSQATLSAILESSSDPIVAIDRQWRLVAMNPATAALVPALIGSLPPMHAHLGRIPERFAAPWRALIERALGGERFTVERSLPIGASARSFSISFNPTVQDDAVTGVAIFGRETTEFRRAEEQARQHQAELAHVLRLHTMGEMAASLAHEVNQPLGAIANYAQGARNRIKAGDISDRELLAVVEDIARQALRAGEITRRVRELLRKEREEPHAAVEVGELVTVAVEIIAPAAGRHEVEILVSPTASPARVLVDRIQIEQVLLNLLLNAVDATASAGGPRRVEVHTDVGSADLVEVSVRDNGPGLAAGMEARIFEPFFTTKPGGLGMGLAISRSIVTAHGGRLWVTASPGGGANFRFTLPVAEPA